MLDFPLHSIGLERLLKDFSKEDCWRRASRRYIYIDVRKRKMHEPTLKMEFSIVLHG